MIRLFVALSIPDDVRARLILLQSGLRGARWRPPENFHLTLSFIGEVDEPLMADLALALNAIDAPGFALTLAGCGQFGDKRPRAVWAGVRASEPLLHLQQKVERAAIEAGLEPDARKFTPHVTLAYFSGAKAGDVAGFTAQHSLFEAPAFPVDAFHLYSSRLGHGGGVYRIEQSFALDPGTP